LREKDCGDGGIGEGGIREREGFRELFFVLA